MSRPIAVEEMVRQFKARHQSSHIFKIDKFSLLRKYQIEDCESSGFEIGGYKWKLILYPNGNENENGKGYISLYLEIQDLGSLSFNRQLKVHWTVFVLNQYKQIWKPEEGTSVFNASKIRSGTARLIPLSTLYDGKQGYLVGDCALLGAKITVLQGAKAGAKAGTAECFTLTEKPPNNKATWKMMNFSAFSQYNYYSSDEFVIGDRKWKIIVCPKGIINGEGNSLSVFLLGDDYVENTPKTKIYTKFKLRVLNQIHRNHVQNIVSYWFPVNPSESGVVKFMPLQDLQDPSKGFLVNDTLYVGAEIDVISRTKYC